MAVLGTAGGTCMKANLKSLVTLQSLDADGIDRLRELEIVNLGDLLGYPPFRHARYLRAARDNLLRRDEVIGYVDGAHQKKTLDDLLEASTEVIRNVGPKQAGVLEKLGLRTVAELAA